MADYQLQKKVNAQGQTYFDYINYMDGGDGFALFRNGDKGQDGLSYPKVDLSLWDQATMCGTCHVGGVFYEKDRNGNRLPGRTLADWGPAFGGQSPNVNAATSTVWENYDPVTGVDKSFVTMSPWVYPVYMGMGGAPDPRLPGGGPMVVPYGWGQPIPELANPNGGAPYTVVAGQLMMPNVKEMDCLFCHLKGYDNVMASVMTQAGSLSAVPATGAGLFDMFSLSPTYMGYDPRNGKTAFTRISQTPMGQMLPQMGFESYSSHELVSLTSAVTGNIKGKPDDNNCHQCHATKTLKNFPEMFGVTGTSTGFLSSAPVIFDPAFGVGPTGKRMVNWDINAPFMQSGKSPVITAENFSSFMMTGLSYLQAAGPSPFNSLKPGEIGGGNDAMTGPLYYYRMDGSVDQNALKKSTMPFPRAEWFKRGDAWQSGQDVHSGVGCAGCHFTGDTTNKNQCDPARGFDMASTIQDGLPAFKNGQPVADPGLTVAETIKKHDTRNTVKRCEFCHITGKDYYGNPIDTMGAPNPNNAHQNAGLLANLTQIVDRYTLHGSFGGKGVPRETEFTSTDDGTATGAGGTILGKGNHLDVMDCTVCHVNKVSMAVRSLDASSGMRYPAIVGTDPRAGMMGLFEDPTGYGAANTGMGGELKQWKPLHLWQAYGNQQLPLSMGNKPADQQSFQFRRKIYLTNAITAILWNNEDENVDANGDGIPGGMLIGDDPATGLPRQDGTTKKSLEGYRDIFTNEVPDHNNTAGFDVPIFDPWIQKDLKSGFNFGAAPLSVISVGFGGFGTPAGTTDRYLGKYANLYNPATGMFNNDNWKYASVWSGAVVFTEPDQIAAYKQYRTDIAAATDGKSWEKTRLTFVGAPFMVTHGIKPTTSYVKGKSCSDCHAPDKEFFKGGFDMVGPALPATTSYDANSYPATDKFGNIVLDANGEPVRPLLDPEHPAYNNYDKGNMMMRPLEPVRVKAKKTDIRGYLETHNKLGQPREVSFIKEIPNTEFAVASTIDRSDALYPSEDGAIYYKAGDVNPDGSLNPGAVAMNGEEYATYLETEIKPDVTYYGLGVNPVAAINAIADASSDLGVQVKQSTAVALSAPLAQPDKTGTADAGTVRYTWSSSDTAAEITNANSRTAASIKFNTPGTKTVKLTVVDEEGKVSYASTSVTVIAPGVVIEWDAVNDTAKFSSLPDGTTSVKITWGDGTTTTRSGTSLTNPLLVKHAYSTATAKTIKLYCYSTTGAQIGYQQAIIMP